MGRGKLNMELISKEKSRNATFLKRKKGLKKKTYEFSTLCGVDACMILYGPKQGNRPMEPEIWPENHYEVLRIIDRYQQIDNDDRRKRNLDLVDMFKDRKKKIEDELAKLRQKNETQYQTWDSRIDDFTEDQLRQLLITLDSKLEMMNHKIHQLTKGKQRLISMEGGGAGTMIDYSHPAALNQNPCFMQSTYHGNIGKDAILAQPITTVKPVLDQQMVAMANNLSDPSLIFDVGPLMEPMMPANGFHYHNFSNGPIGGNLSSYTSMNRPFVYDQGLRTSNGLEFTNVVGPSSSSFCLSMPSNIQSITPYTVPYLNMPGTSPQMNFQPFDDHLDYQDSQIMHKSTRF